MLISNRRGAAVLASAAILMSACSSSGGGSVSTSKLESKLKSESSIKTITTQGGAKGAVANKLVDCIAKALKKDADPADLKKYVSGKMNLADIGGKGKGSAAAAQSDAKTCAQNVVKQAQSSSAAG